MIPELFCAPLAEITTPALRYLIRKFSSKVMLHTEMISSAALLNGGQFNQSKTIVHDFDHPVGFQLLGTNAQIMAKAAKELLKQNPYSIDINMGCSAPDIRKRGAGSYLLKDYDNVAKIVQGVRNSCDCRVSVKMRAGITESSAEFVIKYLKLFKDYGIDYVTLHPRNAHEGFRHTASRKLFTEIKNQSPIQLIYNGDISETTEAVDLIRDFNNKIMIGRAAAVKPWIFGQIENRINGKNNSIIDLAECTEIFIEKIHQFLPSKIQTLRSLRFFGYFCNNFRFGHYLFSEIKKKESVSEMGKVIFDYLQRHPEERAFDL